MKSITKHYVIIILLFLIGISGFLFYNFYNNKSVKISIVGDILLDRGVKAYINREGVNYPYLEVKDILKKSDISYGNLECPITEKKNPVLKEKRLVFRADAANAKSLEAAGFNILSLANNHSMDQNSIGLMDTIKNLNSAGVKTVGAGLNRNEANKPLFTKISGTTVGILSFSRFPSEGYFFSEDKPDIAYVNENIEKTVRSAKGNCDFLIVNFHWGKEFNNYPSDYQFELAHIMISDGADMVIGHHPHVLQGVEKYKGKFIFYSLGNFIFDTQTRKGTDETLILNLTIKKNEVKQVEIIPAKISHSQPKPLSGKEAEQLIKKLQQYSIDMNSKITFKDNKWCID